MLKGALGALAMSLAVTGCVPTRQVRNAGCTSELMYDGTPYCTHGILTREGPGRPTFPLGTAQPWRDGEVDPSQAQVPVWGFHFVAPSRVIAVRVPGTGHDLVLYLTEHSWPRWRKSFLETVNLSNALSPVRGHRSSADEHPHSRR